jgi:hypothetical protein
MRERHYPRFDTTVCPDRAECSNRYHPRLEEGDVCECCGVEMGAPPCCPAYAEYLAERQLPGHSPDCPKVGQR